MNKAFVVDIGNSLTKIAYVDLKSQKIDFIHAYGTKKLLFWKNKILSDLNYDLEAKIYIASIALKASKVFLEVVDKKRATVFIENEMFNKIVKEEFDINEVGVDILASTYYSLKKYKSALLISCGTAIFASINFDQKLQGVLIMPSFIKAFESLKDKCELIDDISLLKFEDSFGFNTNTSISGGYFHMLNGTFKSIVAFANKKYGIKNVIICGGNHKNVKKLKFSEDFDLDFSNPHVVITGIIYLINDLNI